jgi:hypothetical protein
MFSTIPDTLCEPERSSSALKIIMTYLRYFVGYLILNGLVALNIHGKMKEIIKTFTKQNFTTNFIL